MMLSASFYVALPFGFLTTGPNLIATICTYKVRIMKAACFFILFLQLHHCLIRNSLTGLKTKYSIETNCVLQMKSNNRRHFLIEITWDKVKSHL